MKALVLFASALSLTSTAWANLESQTCASFARGAAEAQYIVDVGVIQGHGFQSSVVEYKTIQATNQAEVLVEVLGYDDDQYSWTEKYAVVVNLPVCSVAQVYKVQ